MGCCRGGLRPSEVVRQTIPDPADQAPLVARSVTPPSPSGRGGGDTASAACTSILYRVCKLMTPPNLEHTSKGRARRSRGPVPRGIDPIQCSSARRCRRQTQPRQRRRLRRRGFSCHKILTSKQTLPPPARSPPSGAAYAQSTHRHTRLTSANTHERIAT